MKACIRKNFSTPPVARSFAVAQAPWPLAKPLRLRSRTPPVSSPRSGGRRTVSPGEGWICASTPSCLSRQLILSHISIRITCPVLPREPKPLAVVTFRDPLYGFEVRFGRSENHGSRLALTCQKSTFRDLESRRGPGQSAPNGQSSTAIGGRCSSARALTGTDELGLIT